MTSVISLPLSHREATQRAALGPGLVPGSGLLLTDLYELNMVQAYLDAGMGRPDGDGSSPDSKELDQA